MLIDRYIITRFLTNFVILLLLLFLFAVVIDIILQLDDYVDAAREGLEPGAGLHQVFWSFVMTIINFHGPRLFQFYAYLLGLVTVGAMGFTLAQMHRHRELVALLSAGISLHRIAMPFIAAAFALNVLQLVNQELILPRVAPLLIRSHGDLGQSGVRSFEVYLTRDGKGSLFQSPSFDPGTAMLTAPTILERDAQGRTVRRITAESATWSEADRAWRLQGGRAVARTLAEAGTTTSRDAEVIVLYPTDLTPKVLTIRRYGEFASMLSLDQISEMMQTPGVVDLAALARYKYARFSAVLSNLLVLILTLPFFLLREPANLLKQSVLCAATALPAMLGALIGMSVDLPGFTPAASVFLPAILLIPLALFSVTQIRT